MKALVILLMVLVTIANLVWGITIVQLNHRLTKAEILIECLVDWSKEVIP